MWGRIITTMILVIIANIYQATCEGQSSLTFVIDDTLSMTDDIRQVKQSVNKIMDIVFNEKASLIKNLVLVTFNDPDVKLRKVTERRDVFVQHLNAVEVNNPKNTDCPEMSMHGIIKGLENSLPKSFLYVFTDASSKDYNQKDTVIDLCQRKQSQIVFVITGYCWDLNRPSFQVYYEIASACSGLVFFMHKDYVEQIFTPIGENIQGNKTLLLKATVPTGKATKIPFEVDSKTDHVIASASGNGGVFSITGYFRGFKKLMWNYNGKVLKLSGTQPGTYEVYVKGDTEMNVIVFGATDFVFSHGFSELVPKTPKDTTPQPIADSKVYLSISTTDPNGEVKIKTANIYQDGKLKNTLPLKKLSKDFYITESFVAPSTVFQVGIAGEIIATGKPIIRMAPIPITPQKPKLPDKTKPSAEISEGKSIEIEYDSTVKLTCKVRAYPKPEIRWFNSEGTSLDKIMIETSLLQAPYEYISYLTIKDVKKGNKYVCYAVNDLDKDAKTVEVTVKDAFTVNTVPKAKTNVNYGSEGTITCDIKSKQSMRIRWYYIDEYTGNNNEISSGDKYQISADGTQLKINKMDIGLAGRYICKASLVKDENEKKTFHTIVRITGLVRPKLSGVPEKKVIKGKSTTLECNVIKGVPKPTITWEFMRIGSSKFAELESTGNILSLKNVEVNQAGRYKCVASNHAGKDELNTTLTVQVLPKLTGKPTDSKPTKYEPIEGVDMLKLPCAAEGLPKPIITWYSGSRRITPDAKHSIVDGFMIINHPEVTDSNIYTCKANNEAGEDTITFPVEVLQKPEAKLDPSIKIKLGTSSEVRCAVIKGVPKPTVTWKKKVNSKWESIHTGEKLVFRNIREKDAGTYQCTVQNKLDTKDYVTEIIVVSPPTKTRDAAAVHEGVVGDVAMRIPCPVTGNPRPTIAWNLGDTVITPSTKYAIEDGDLIILKPDKSDTGRYTCKAVNYLGSVSATVDATVTSELKTYGIQHNVYAREGTPTKLECGSYRSKSQSVVWYTVATPARNYTSYRRYRSIEGANIYETKPYMIFENPTRSNDGNYTCRMTDIHGHTETHTYVVDFGYPPNFKNPTSSINDWTGNVKEILAKCDSDAKPEANVEWEYNGKVFNNYDFVQYLDNLENTHFWGQYKCNVSNVHGSVQRSFDVKSSSCLISRRMEENNIMPLVLTDELAWPEFEGTNRYLFVEQKASVTLACPKYKGEFNPFENFKQDTIKLVCDKEDSFSMDGKQFKISDFRCHSPGDIALVMKKECLSKNSELILVGYNSHRFLRTYEVCFDKVNKMPLYSRVDMSTTEENLSNSYEWIKDPELGDTKFENVVTCKNATSSCCYTKSQLVHGQDFRYGAAKNTTFIEPLNAITYWRPCDHKQTTWDNIDGTVRDLLNTYESFTAWSGVHTLQNIKGVMVPRYLWKVLRFEEDNTIAIIHINDPSPLTKDVKCTNICEEFEEFKFTENTYCCSVDQFLEAFDLGESDIGV